MPHPPASKDLKISTFPLGCGICRSEKLGAMKDNSMLIQEVELPPKPEPAIMKVPAKPVEQPKPVIVVQPAKPVDLSKLAQEK